MASIVPSKAKNGYRLRNGSKDYAHNIPIPEPSLADLLALHYLKPVYIKSSSNNCSTGQMLKSATCRRFTTPSIQSFQKGMAKSEYTRNVVVMEQVHRIRFSIIKGATHPDTPIPCKQNCVTN